MCYVLNYVLPSYYGSTILNFIIIIIYTAVSSIISLKYIIRDDINNKNMYYIFLEVNALIVNYTSIVCSFCCMICYDEKQTRFTFELQQDAYNDHLIFAFIELVMVFK